MRDATPYRDDAMRMSEAEFRDRYAGAYLVKRPTAAHAESGQPGRSGFHTRILDLGPGEDEAEAARNAALGDWAPRWWVAELRVAEEGLDRINVGRTNNCDVTIPLPFVSKLHAQFYVNADGSIDIVDRSSNGVIHEGKEIPKGERIRVEVGDRLSFGALDLQLVNGTLLYRMLRVRASVRAR